MFSWGTSLQLVSILLLLLPLLPESASLKAARFNSSATNFSKQCTEIERKSLLQFRKSLTDPSGKLSSWVGKDCCSWNGVGCNKKTGNVVKLDLRSEGDYGSSSYLGGEISPSLLDLKHLNYLDLSMNDFQGIAIPKFMGSLRKLRYLNLSQASFAGMVPPHLGNLSNLRYLDLSAFLGLGNSWVSDLNWLSGLSSLKYLNLGSVSLGKATAWLEAINTLPFLSELHLSDCELRNFPHSQFPTWNLTLLSVLDLSINKLNSSILPKWGNGNHCNLQYIDLSVNEISGDVSELLGVLFGCSNSLEELKLSSNLFKGQLPDSLGRLKYLRSLLLNENLISGPIPASIESLWFLQELDLSFNYMNGSIPESVGKLTNLTKLQLYQNSWNGMVSQKLFQSLTELKDFSISSSSTTSFVLDVKNEWVPSFSLRSIQIGNFPLGPKFPSWLKTQTELSTIVLTNVSISHTIPYWLWELSPQIEKLDLSHNKIGGVLPTSTEFSYVVDLSFNRLDGPIPLWPNVMFLYLGNNSFTGLIPPNIGQVMSSLRVLDFSRNSLIGRIPSSIRKLANLITLDLSNNHLTGKIPSHWENLQILGSIDLSNNNLSGEIPSSICSIPFLDWLKLSSNNLYGNLSLSLQNCTSLSTLDLGNNRFSGKIPQWIGESILLLSELRLRANQFSGNIPKQICRLSHLHILDLAQNNLSGSIPTCLGNLSGLSSLAFYGSLPPALRLFYTPQMDLVVKGRQMGYTSTLELVNIIDLSSNNLNGEIPAEMMNLSTLGTLNLSRNQLSGKIPEKIGGLQRLETLDLSINHLSGTIPSSMSSITSLSHLNLSHNNLSGPIPSTNQFLTFNDPSIYEGNFGLCGPPLPVKCHKANDGHIKDRGDKEEDENEDKYDKLWLYLSTGLGFIVGFWAVFGSLVIKKSWRIAYFRFLDKAKDWIFVVISINLARFQRMMEMNRN